MFSIDLVDKTVIDRFATASAFTSLETTNWLVDMAMWIKADLKQRVPVKTGALKSSIRYELSKAATGGGEATYHSVFYGKYVDEGTQPFTVHATSKPMAFYRGSDRIFAMVVNNPGIKARNFTLDTLEAAAPEANRQAELVAERVFKAVIG